MKSLKDLKKENIQDLPQIVLMLKDAFCEEMYPLLFGRNELYDIGVHLARTKSQQYVFPGWKLLFAIGIALQTLP